MMATAAAGQTTTIRPQRHADVRQVADPDRARDGNPGTFASAGLNRICSSDCRHRLDASVTFDRFPSGYRGGELEVAWHASASFGLRSANAGSVVAAVEYSLGREWRRLERFSWTSSSAACLPAATDEVTCFDHVARLTLDPRQDLTLLRVRVTASAQLTTCTACTSFGISNLNGQLKIFDVRVLTGDRRSTARPRRRSR